MSPLLPTKKPVVVKKPVISQTPNCSPDHGTDGQIRTRGVLQVVGGNQFKTGIRVQRAKAKHLRPSMRKIAVRTFMLHQSEEDAARAIDQPGITGRTVLSTAVLDALNRLEMLERVTGIVRCA